MGSTSLRKEMKAKFPKFKRGHPTREQQKLARQALVAFAERAATDKDPWRPLFQARRVGLDTSQDSLRRAIGVVRSPRGVCVLTVAVRSAMNAVCERARSVTVCCHGVHTIEVARAAAVTARVRSPSAA